MDRTLYLVLPQLRCRLSPPKTCKQLKLCEIERFCTESPESASPGLIAQSNRLRISNLVTFSGSPQESDEVGILSGFLEGDEFGLGSGQSLCLEKEIVDVTVAPASAKDRLDISVDCFHHAQRNFIRAIVQDSIEMLD